MDEVSAAKTVVETAQVPGPFAASNLLPTVYMVLVAMLGGAASFIQKLRTGKVRAFNFLELVGEMLISTMVGLCTYWLCKAYGVSEYLTVAGVAITGHMGTRAIALAEHWLEEKFGVKLLEEENNVSK